MSNINPTRKVVINAAKKNLFFSCHIDLTFCCNLNCAHCYIVKENRPELTVFEIKDLLDQLAALNVLYLIFSGGEALLRQDFFEICAYARKLHFALHILTNATLINNETANNLIAIRPEYLSISVYSMNPKIHDAITGTPGSLEKTLQALKLLHQKNIKFRIATVIMKHNLNEYLGISAMAKEMNAQHVLDLKITPKTNGDRSPQQFQLSDKELELLINKEHQNTRGTPRPLFDEKEINSTLSQANLLCCASHSSCYVSPYGDITPCVQSSLVCGNIREQSLTNIWTNSPSMLRFRSLRTTDFKKCINCELSQHCRPCPALSHLEENDLTAAPKSMCRHASIVKKVMDTQKKSYNPNTDISAE